MDPQVEWVHPAVTRLPFDGIIRGLPSVLRGAFRRDEDSSGPQVSTYIFMEFGDGVLVAGQLLGGRSGEADELFLHECFVRGGRIFLIREYPA